MATKNSNNNNKCKNIIKWRLKRYSLGESITKEKELESKRDNMHPRRVAGDKDKLIKDDVEEGWLAERNEIRTLFRGEKIEERGEIKKGQQEIKSCCISVVEGREKGCVWQDSMKNIDTRNRRNRKLYKENHSSWSIAQVGKERWGRGENRKAVRR